MKIVKSSKTGLLALATDDNKLVTKYKYSKIDPSNKYKLYRVEVKSNDKELNLYFGKDIKQGVVNEFGQTIIPVRYYDEEEISYDENGHCIVHTEEKVGLYSTTGPVFNPELFEGGISTPINGTYIIERNFESCDLYISSTGLKVRLGYDDMSTFNKFGLALSKREFYRPYIDGGALETYGIINILGTEILPCEYKKIVGFPPLTRDCVNSAYMYDLPEKIALIRAKADNYYKGLVLIQNRLGFWCAINLNSKNTELKFEYYQESVNFDGKHVALCKFNPAEEGALVWGVLDYNCNVVVPFWYMSESEALQALNPNEPIVEPITTVIEKPFTIAKRKK